MFWYFNVWWQKVIGSVSNSIKRKQFIMINFSSSLDYDIGCSMFCKVHFELNIYPFGNFSFGFERLKCMFQIFISFLTSFLNRFEYNAIILDSLTKKLPLWLSKKSIVLC
jgi:hypothetical protein